MTEMQWRYSYVYDARLGKLFLLIKGYLDKCQDKTKAQGCEKIQRIIDSFKYLLNASLYSSFLRPVFFACYFVNFVLAWASFMIWVNQCEFSNKFEEDLPNIKNIMKLTNQATTK